MSKQKVIVYVDGFNFYFRLKNPARKRYYWLDLVKLFEKFMLKHQELMAVKYFSARPIGNEDKSHQQSMFFDANKPPPSSSWFWTSIFKNDLFPFTGILHLTSCSTDVTMACHRRSTIRFTLQFCLAKHGSTIFTKSCKPRFGDLVGLTQTGVKLS